MGKKQRVEDWEARLGTTSFDPLEVMQLADAIKDRKETVLLGSRNFALSYRGDRVFYSPVEGFAPCGWLDISRIESTGGV